MSRLIVGVCLAVQVPALAADGQWMRAGLLAAGAVILLILGALAGRKLRTERSGPDRDGAEPIDR